MTQTLEIDGIPVPVRSILEFDQQCEQLSGRDARRLADGSYAVRETWTGKLRVTLTGKGWAPAMLEALATGQTHVLRCIVRRQVISTLTTVTLPAARRNDTDHDPLGYAIKGSALVSTPITNLASINAGSSDDAVLTAVSGADGYAVDYWPELTVVVTRNTTTGRQDNRFDWLVEAEQA